MSRLFVVLALAVLLAGSAAAHEVRPAYLALRETAPDRFEVIFKVPTRGDRVLRLAPVLPDTCVADGQPRFERVPGARIMRFAVKCEAGLAGQTVSVDGLASTLTDVLVRIERVDGAVQMGRLQPTSPPFVVEAAPSWLAVARTYTVLGVEHILLGIDHLLFVLALLLLIRSWGRLAATITAFTVAHSLTLAAATLGWVHVPGPPVEAIIALSIVFVAAEIVHGRRGHAGITARAPWIVAFTFGLLHGLGFAGALAELGLPQNAIPLALLAFNVGVELGQLAFLAAVLLAWGVVRGLGLHGSDWLVEAPAYAIGGVATFWTLQRIAGFWS